MTTYKKKIDFFKTEEGLEFKETLKLMAQDKKYRTGPSYSANGDLYPDNLIPFVNKHMDYVKAHPATDPQHYLANLRLITRVR